MNALCPVAAKPGKRVAPLTVRSLIRKEHAADVEGREWFFCDLPDCGVVYFSADGRTLDKQALKVRVGLKEKDSPRPVCYCFGHTVETIRDEIKRTGQTTVAASITAKIEAGECRCEILNPKGTCCLGDVNRAVKEASAALEVPRSAIAHPTSSSASTSHECCGPATDGIQGRPATGTSKGGANHSGRKERGR